MMNAEEAARLLNCKVAEIADIGDSPAGVVISTVDGTAMVVVPEDAPDHEGKTGVMLLAAPSEAPVVTVDGLTYWNAFPLYVSPVVLDDEDDRSPDTGVDYEAMSLKDLKALPEVEALTAEQKKSKPKILAALAELAAAPAAVDLSNPMAAITHELQEATDDELAELVDTHGIDATDRDEIIAVLAPVILAAALVGEND